MEAIALPETLKAYAGRIIDCDSHEMIPAQEWIKHFGPGVKEIAELFIHHETTDAFDRNHPNAPGYAGDLAPIGADVANQKGCRAPGAVDMQRRLQVMDAMGIRRQLLFPTSVGIWSMLLLMYDKFNAELLGEIKEDRSGKAKRWINIYNQWMIDIARTSDRLRPVAPVVGDTVEELIANARPLIENGIRAIWIPAGALPGGKSPAHPDLDPFWDMLAKARCVLMFHVGSEGKFFESAAHREWSNAPAFQGYNAFAEFNTDPWFFSTLHFPVQHFLSTMINGGVLERHPELRIGVGELTGYWVGPMLEALDLWYNTMGSLGEHSSRLSQKPSFYFKRSVRVVPFVFEPVDLYIERHGLEDVFCLGTDYPHVEGGRNVLGTLHAKLERLGPEVLEKFFVTNGEFLFPE